MTRDEVLAIFHRTHSLLEGHFQLTSGLHSSQYFQCAKVLQYPRYAELLCTEIANHFAGAGIDAVMAPALGGIVVGQEVCRLLALRGGAAGLRMMFAERKDGVMQLRRGFELKRGERVLVCEDVVTTGGSTAEVIKIVRAAGAEVIGAACIVDRNGGKVRFDVPPDSQFAVLRLEVVASPPDNCPLCMKKIPVDKPGSRANA